MERDFKGVWIPKEIWLNEELTMIDKVIYTEISSLDGPNHCTASNEYLANFCQCSERKVSESINKLIKLGMIEIVSFDGRCRVVKISKQTSKICESASQNLLSINIDNNINTNKDINNTNVLLNLANSETKTKKPKKNLYQHCLDEIDRYSDPKLKSILVDYLGDMLSRKDEKRLKGFAQWKSLLNKLDDLADDIDTKIKIVNQSIVKHWATFVAIKQYNNEHKLRVFGEPEYVKSVPYSEEEKEDIKKWQEDNHVESF